jgi:ABC-type transporter Mla MlaB component
MVIIKPCDILTIKNVMEELTNIKNQIDIYNEVFCIDLKNIDMIDAAGIAMLVEIKQYAKKCNKHIEYTNHTINITKMCQLYHVKL